MNKFNSTIKQKKCKCGCHRYPSVGYGGFNAICAPMELKIRVSGKRRSVKNEALKRQASKIRLDSYKNGEFAKSEEYALKSSLNAFYGEVSKVIEKNPVCMECKKHIPKSFYRAATAHVLPKRKEYGFPSISTHPDNYLILGAGCGHHQQYDKSWEDAAKMKIWPLAVEKFKILYPLISQEERKNIPEILLQTLSEGSTNHHNAPLKQ